MSCTKVATGPCTRASDGTCSAPKALDPDLTLDVNPVYEDIDSLLVSWEALGAPLADEVVLLYRERTGVVSGQQQVLMSVGDILLSSLPGDTEFRIWIRRETGTHYGVWYPMKAETYPRNAMVFNYAANSQYLYI